MRPDGQDDPLKNAKMIRVGDKWIPVGLQRQIEEPKMAQPNQAIEKNRPPPPVHPGDAKNVDLDLDTHEQVIDNHYMSEQSPNSGQMSIKDDNSANSGQTAVAGKEINQRRKIDVDSPILEEGGSGYAEESIHHTEYGAGSAVTGIGVQKNGAGEPNTDEIQRISVTNKDAVVAQRLEVANTDEVVAKLDERRTNQFEGEPARVVVEGQQNEAIALAGEPKVVPVGEQNPKNVIDQTLEPAKVADVDGIEIEQKDVVRVGEPQISKEEGFETVPEEIRANDEDATKVSSTEHYTYIAYIKDESYELKAGNTIDENERVKIGETTFDVVSADQKNGELVLKPVDEFVKVPDDGYAHHVDEKALSQDVALALEVNGIDYTESLIAEIVDKVKEKIKTEEPEKEEDVTIAKVHIIEDIRKVVPEEEEKNYADLKKEDVQENKGQKLEETEDETRLELARVEAEEAGREKNPDDIEKKDIPKIALVNAGTKKEAEPSFDDELFETEELAERKEKEQNKQRFA